MNKQFSVELSWKLTMFMAELIDGQLSHPLLLTRELHTLLEMAWSEAESSLGENL